MATAFVDIDYLQAGDYSELQSKIDRKLTAIFHNVPFYCAWTNYMKDGYCNENNPRCMQHLIGLPKNKSGGFNPLFDYQQKLFDTLQSKKMVFCLKATGLGITEIMIRYIAWLCLKDNSLANSEIVIITGPRLELSISIIERIKKLFYDLAITYALSIWEQRLYNY